jgi:hypothetical protein
MQSDPNIEEFLSNYNQQVVMNALKLRKILFENLPGITEQIDSQAKLIAYCYGQKYVELICVIIPSKKGLKLGFNRGVDLSDPDKLLEGKGKISRYVEIRSVDQITSASLKTLLTSAVTLYKECMSNAKI